MAAARIPRLTMKATILIESIPGKTACNVTMSFDPPLKPLKAGEKPCAVRLSATAALRAIEQGASSIKAKEIHTRS